MPSARQKIAKGKSLTSKKEQNITKALNVASTGMAGLAGFKVGVNYGNKLFNQSVAAVATHQLQAYGGTVGDAMLKGIQVASVSSTAPYIAGTLALTALAAGAGYAYTKYKTNQGYIKKAEESEEKD